MILLIVQRDLSSLNVFIALVLLCFSTISTAIPTSTLLHSDQNTETEAFHIANKTSNRVADHPDGISTFPTKFLSNHVNEFSKGLIQLNKRNASSIDYANDWDIVYQNVKAFLPSPSVIRTLAGFYENILDTTSKATATSPAKYISFTAGNLQFTLSCASDIIPWELVEEIARFMGTWWKMGFPGLASIVFYAAIGTVKYVICVQLVIVALIPMELPLHNIITVGKRDDEEPGR